MPDPVVCYPSRAKKKALAICSAFADGAGGRVAEPGHDRLEPGPAFFYGWTSHTAPLIRRCRELGRTWYYCDNAYYFGRGKFFRVTRNRLMHDGHGSADPSRWAAFGVDLQPWRTDGEVIVVATQSELFYRERLRRTRDEWSGSVIERLREHTSRGIVVMDKPAPAPGSNLPVHPGFESILPVAWALVTHSSSAAVKALVDGVPVFGRIESMIGPVGLSDYRRIEAPLLPSDDVRRGWLEVLAANQWTRDEMRSGRCWSDLQSTTADLASAAL